MCLSHSSLVDGRAVGDTFITDSYTSFIPLNIHISVSRINFVMSLQFLDCL